MNALVPYAEIERMGAAVAKSGLFGIKTPDQAVALMLIAQAEGLHPAIAARDYHVIQGRPALKADAMLARFQAAGGKVEWKVLTDDKVTGVFSHAQGGSVEITWTIDMAKKIGLATKDNWKNYPRAMLRSRVVSEGIRTVYPGCVVGTYTPEETENIDNRATITVTAAAVEEVAPPPDVPPPPFALYVPGKEEAWGRYHDVTDYVSALCDLVKRLRGNNKLQEDVIEAKVEALLSLNEPQIRELPEESQNLIGMLK